MTNINFSRSEKRVIIISIILLGFLFSFKQWGTDRFDILFGIGNWLRASIVAAVSLLIMILVKKLVANKYGTEIEYRIWSIKRYGFSPSSKLPKKILGSEVNSIALGIILPLILIFITNGSLIFAGVGITLFLSNAALRLGRKYQYLSEFEVAMMSLAGPLTSLLLAMIFKIVGFSGVTFDLFVKMNFYLAFFSMLPLPNFDGIRIFFASRFLYILIFAFIILTIILSLYINGFSSIILALIISLVMAIIYFYFLQFK